MSYKKYMLFRLLGAMVIAFLGAWAATTGNIPLLIPAIIIIGVILFSLKKKVKEVIVDERVNTIAYRASRLAFLVFVILAVIAGITLTNLARDISDALFHVGLTLDYAACALVVFYWLAYIYYNRKLGGKE